MSEETNNNLEFRSYSKVYKMLVKGEDDLAGQIAYAIYKQHKIEKITRFTKRQPESPLL